MATLYVNFYHQLHRTKKDGTAPIIARVVLNGERADISTGVSVSPDDWDDKKERVKGRSERSMHDNMLISTITGKIYQAYQDAMIQSDDSSYLTAKEIKTQVVGSKKKSKTLVDLFDEHNAHFQERIRAGDAAPGSLTKYRTVRDHVVEFLGEAFPVRKMDGDHVNEFHHFLRTQKGIGHNTTVKYVRALGKVLRIAVRKGELKVDPTVHYNGTIKKKDPTFLTQSELDAIWEAEIDNESLNRVRDFFLFSCYTGLAYSDLQALSLSNIQEIRGKKWIVEGRAKTKVTSRIPILSTAQAIIDKYESQRQIVKDGRLFPVPSNQKVNEYLKAIAVLAGINKHLTFHVARHTFATTVTLANGVDLKSVSAMLGHSSIRMTEHYARIVDEKLDSDMEALEKKLSAGTSRS